MNIQYFDFAGETLPVCFPFDAFNDLMGDYGFAGYVGIYQSPRFQLKILYTGLKYGHLNEGKSFTMTEKRVELLGKNNIGVLAKVWRFHESELIDYMAKFSVQEEEDTNNVEELGKQKKIQVSEK